MNNTAQSPTLPFERPSNIAVLVIGICVIVINGILLLVMLLDPLKCFRRPSMYFVISLSLSDLFTGIASCMFAMTKYVSSKYFFIIPRSVIWASVQNSFVTILLMAIERLIAIRYPIKAKSIITTRRILIAITVTWLISILLGVGVSLPQPYGQYIMFVYLVECFLIILIMLGIYFRMIVLLRDSFRVFHGKQFTRHSRTQSGQKPAVSTYQRSLNVVVFYLALVLIITVLPHLILGQIYLGYDFFYPQKEKPVALQCAPYITFPVELLNFLLNAVIYVYRLPQFRAALCYYLKRKRQNRRHEGAMLVFSRHKSSSKGNNSDDTMI